MRIKSQDHWYDCLAIFMSGLAIFFCALLIALGGTDAAADHLDLIPKYASDAMSTQAGGEAEFNYTLRNVDSFYISTEMEIDLLDEPDNWTHLLEANTKDGVRASTTVLNLLMARNESTNLSVRLYPPDSAPNGTYWMTVIAFVKDSPHVNESHRICIIVGKVQGFEFIISNEPVEGYFAAIPPSQITMRFVLRNTGTSNDRFRITYTSSRASEGWSISPIVPGLSPDGWTPSLAGDPTGRTSHFIDFNVLIPEDVYPNLECLISVVATSEIGQSPYSQTANTTAMSLQYFDFQVYINGSDQKECAPGEQVMFQLRIWNKGNGYERFTITPIWDEMLAPGFVATSDPSTIEVPRGGTALVSYIVSVPENAPKKVYFFTASVASSSPDLAIITKSFEVKVLQFFGVTLSSPEPIMTTFPGGILDFKVYVKNAGNGLDSMTVKLQGTPLKWLTYIQPAEVSLLQDEKAFISIRIIVPSMFDKSPSRLYNITVVGESDRSGANGTLVLQVNLLPVYRIEWMYNNLPITDLSIPIAQPDRIMPRRLLNPIEKNWFEFPVELKNLGNIEDNVMVVASSADPRIIVTVTPGSITLRWDQALICRFHVTVPQDLSPGVYRFYANASSQDLRQPTRVVPIDFEVYHVDVALDPIPIYRKSALEDLTLGEVNITQGMNLSLGLSVTNLGGQPVGPLLIRAFDVYLDGGQVLRWNFLNITTPELKVGETYRFGGYRFRGTLSPNMKWWANVTGLHTLEFRVELDHQWNTTNDISSMNVTVLKIPQEAETPLITPTGWLVFGVLVMTLVVIIGRSFVMRKRRTSR